MVQMIKVGEETGELGNILKTMAKFYEREMINAVDTLVSLIEPVMIVALGLGVGIEEEKQREKQLLDDLSAIEARIGKEIWDIEQLELNS
mgnify:CR=1 FL=1